MADRENDSGRTQGAKGFLKDLQAHYASDRVPLAAGAVAFFLTVSLVPLLLLAISVAAFFVSPSQAQALVHGLTASLGAGVGDALRTQVLTVVDHRGLLTGISLLVGLWSGSQVFVYIQMALNQVWNLNEDRPLWKTRGLAILMVFIAGVLLLLIIGLTAAVHLVSGSQILGRQLPHLPWLVTALVVVVLPTLLIAALFTIIYRYLPSRRIPWRVILPGAIVGAVLWEITLQLFSWYTASFANYNALYGSLGGLILVMLWFNYSAQILLLGAEISSVLEQRRSNQPHAASAAT